MTFYTDKPLKDYNSLPSVSIYKDAAYVNVPKVRPSTEPFDWHSNQSVLNQTPFGLWECRIAQPTILDAMAFIYQIHLKIAVARHLWPPTGMNRIAVFANLDNVPKIPHGYDHVYRLRSLPDRQELELVLASDGAGDGVNNG